MPGDAGTRPALQPPGKLIKRNHKKPGKWSFTAKSLRLALLHPTRSAIPGSLPSKRVDAARRGKFGSRPPSRVTGLCWEHPAKLAGGARAGALLRPGACSGGFPGVIQAQNSQVKRKERWKLGKRFPAAWKGHFGASLGGNSERASSRWCVSPPNPAEIDDPLSAADLSLSLPRILLLVLLLVYSVPFPT